MSTQLTGHLQITPRAFVLHYRPGRDNCCPGCGHSNWFVGRTAAECAMCTMVLPLKEQVTIQYREALAA